MIPSKRNEPSIERQQPRGPGCHHSDREQFSEHIFLPGHGGTAGKQSLSPANTAFAWAAIGQPPRYNRGWRRLLLKPANTFHPIVSNKTKPAIKAIYLCLFVSQDCHTRENQAARDPGGGGWGVGEEMLQPIVEKNLAVFLLPPPSPLATSISLWILSAKKMFSLFEKLLRLSPETGLSAELHCFEAE